VAFPVILGAIAGAIGVIALDEHTKSRRDNHNEDDIMIDISNLTNEEKNDIYHGTGNTQVSYTKENH